ncbi:RNA polymerase sigma-70 factor, ECF subfamily [Flavobacterium flevense]|uniref:DNA-directed RNA polymerase sigma-70 factor n=1 Tax=Flavobacterium flevense TaxID=983 RepID=A0A4Y4AZM8_9FLAO|nr:sigma-70 family RNA polymerase sigma factor [Flavobacterium flevense]GEC72500.1 DNA-directed RNA polymerase sigma-70 factor [Flavobacterium flevense]SHM13742.1 RNA polymerase sigma-70 factor, ECF subfamily [Flavobacterium flevense]
MNNTVHVELEGLFLLYYKEWYFLSYSYLKDREEAEEIVQDVCAKILVRNSTEKILNLKSYVIIAIKNSCLKKLKKQQKLVSLTEIDVDCLLSDEDTSVLDDKIFLIHKALEQLPQPSKDIFIRCVIEGEKYQFVAESMNISINTVKYHIKSAYKKMRIEMIGISFLLLFLLKNIWKQ